MKDLRPYQQAALDAINKNLPKTNKQVVVMPTGSGKSIVFCHLIKQRKHLGKILLLAHRSELLTQPAEKLLEIDPTLDIQIEMAEQKAEPTADVVIASVPTLGRTNSERIKKFDPNHFRTIIGDEFHHFSSTTNKNILRYFGVLKKESDWNKDCLLVGFTATPRRADNQHLNEVADEIVYRYDIKDAMQEGYLARVRAYRVDTTTSIDNVGATSEDFVQHELADAINNRERNELIVKTYQEQFSGKQVVVFAVDVQHAKDLEKLFQEKEVKAIEIDGTTPKDLRKQMLRDYSEKNTNVIVNVGVMTEGIDIPTIDAVFLARPTKSTVLFSQMAGRCMRPHPNKPYASLVDFVDNSSRHRLVTASSLMGMEGNINYRGEDILEAQEQIDKIRELAPDYNLDHLDFGKLNYLMEEIDIMSGLEIPKDIEPITHYSWLRFGEGYRIGIGEGRYFVVEKDLLGKWVCSYEYWDRETHKTISEWLGEEEVLDFMIERVDKFIASNYSETVKLVNMNSDWRNKPLKEPQYDLLRKLGVSSDVIIQLNRGKAAQLTNKLLSQKRSYR